MLEQILNLLQTLLLPLVLGAVALAGLLVYLVGRKPGAKPAAKPRPGRAPAQPPSPSTSPPVQARSRPAPPMAPAPPLARTPAPAPAPSTPPSPPLPAPPTPAPAPALAEAPAAAALTPSPPPEPPATPPLQADLLLVDDSAVVRAKLRRLFEPAGYQIRLAHDGDEALALLGQGRYGLMVTDLEMPKLDGVGLIRASLALPGCAGMPILAITGHDDLQSQLNQLNAVAGIYRKPWVDDDLLGHVQALIAPSGVPADATEEA